MTAHGATITTNDERAREPEADADAEGQLRDVGQPQARDEEEQHNLRPRNALRAPSRVTRHASLLTMVPRTSKKLSAGQIRCFGLARLTKS